jgi:nitric oxide reductase subunit B
VAVGPHHAVPGLCALWIILIAIVVVSFTALLYYGREIYQESPPVPETVATSDGEVIFTSDQIRTGQDVWRSVGGQELGSVWGHGA